jgi:hyperosmotically inducible protein
MKPTILGRFLMAAMIFGAGIAGASNKDKATLPQSDADIIKNVRHEIVMYPYYTLWDDISFRVNNGQVELMGAVNQPYKKSDIEKLVQRVPGVTSVTDDLKVLPLSPFDDRLRLQIARSIYGFPALNRYAMDPLKPIHIIVENGHVTLTGIVSTDGDKQLAGMRASVVGLSLGQVTNNLQVEHPSPKKS